MQPRMGPMWVTEYGSHGIMQLHSKRPDVRTSSVWAWVSGCLR